MSLELLRLGQSVLQVAELPFRVDLLKREVLRRAFADSFATQLGQGTTRDRHDPRFEVRVVDGIGLQLVQQAQLKVVPLARHLAQVVALLPPLQPVRRRILSPLGPSRRTLPPVPVAQPLLERVEHGRNMVVELAPWKRVPRADLGVCIHRHAPRLQDQRSAQVQMRGKRSKALGDTLG